MKNLKLAVAQMTSVDRMEDNLKSVLAGIHAAADQSAHLLVFPENSLYLRLSSEPLKLFDLAGKESAAIRAACDKAGMDVMLTTPTPGAGGKAKNSTIHYSPGRTPTIVYSKIHMFDVEVEGAPPVRESERFEAGAGTGIVEICGWKFGLSICYDLRFPELYIHYADKVDAILIPSAFLVPTGKAHWHVMLRARAIEHQCYVVAPAQGGQHKSASGVSRETFGHSLVVDPWGHVEMDNDFGPGVKTVELSVEKIAWVRKQIPMQHHRRMLRSDL